MAKVLCKLLHRDTPYKNACFRQKSRQNPPLCAGVAFAAGLTAFFGRPLPRNLRAFCYGHAPSFLFLISPYLAHVFRGDNVHTEAFLAISVHVHLMTVADDCGGLEPRPWRRGRPKLWRPRPAHRTRQPLPRPKRHCVHDGALGIIYVGVLT